jgi:hypothetical protein
VKSVAEKYLCKRSLYAKETNLNYADPIDRQEVPFCCPVSKQFVAIGEVFDL